MGFFVEPCAEFSSEGEEAKGRKEGLQLVNSIVPSQQSAVSLFYFMHACNIDVDY